MLTAHLLPGLLTGFGLIVAIGAQNAWVLRQGLARDHVAVIVTICALADLLLVVIGTAGLGALIGDHPAILTGMKWLGAAYLAWFGIRSLWSARHAGALGGGQSPSRSRGSVITAGAGVASIAWFTTLGFGARALSGPLSRPRTWQVLDTLIGLVMLTLAVVLLRS